MYVRRQKGRFHPVLAMLGVLFLTLSPRFPEWVDMLFLGIGVVLLLAALSFAHLTVSDAGDRLRIAFGPLPLFRRSVPYGEVRSIRPGRSDFLDGMGIHWWPGRGWIWNIRSGGLVEIELEDGLLRVGSEDPEELVAHVRARMDRSSG